MPDFVVEAEDFVLMVEAKARKEMTAAIRWCKHASEYLLENGGKEWKYLLVSHDDVIEKNTLSAYI
ncbi:MAG: hypothetical protein V3V12_01720 [Gammaproteobacteria bacterium]